ncbi:FtsQ-type POTRA domain-containing protein [Candidatus Roizmanbacteria bacterium]|nr:FtsQ-type POTRA domain-containing protein [Candidatus Roizmanbacteria bacterium]
MKLLKSKLVVIAALCCILGIAVFLSFFNEWRVKIIRVQGIPKETLLNGLENIKNVPLLTLSLQAVEERMRKSNPFIARIQAVKKYPQTLILTVSTDEPLLYFESDSGYFALNQEGKILSKWKELPVMSDLPIIHYFEKFHFSSYQPGDRLSYKDIIMALKIAKKMMGMGMKINTIDIDGVDMIGFRLKGKVIVFSSEKDIDTQIYQLEQIVHQFKIQGTDFKRLDLRFNRPVLELVE